DSGPSQTIDEVLRSTRALLVGGRTQDVEDRLQQGFYGGAFRGPFFVLRHDPPSKPPVVKGVTGRFLDLAIEKAVEVAKGAADAGDVVIFGANVARHCLEAGLLDEIIVHVAPILVGDGGRFFERAGGFRRRDGACPIMAPAYTEMRCSARCYSAPSCLPAPDVRYRPSAGTNMGPTSHGS